MATGSGKGSVLAWLPDALGFVHGTDQMIVCVHRNDLVDQLAKRIRRYNPKLLVAVEQGINKANKFADIIVASIQSISGDSRLEKFDPNIRFVVVDEAHIAPGSRAYDKVLSYFGVVKDAPTFNPSKISIGFTATPDRPDGKGLDYLYDEISFQRDAVDLMRDGIYHKGEFLNYLLEPKCYSVKTTVDLDKLKKEGGDFNIGELERTINNPYRNDIIVDNYKKYGEGLPAICFTCDIQHARDVVLAFEKGGLIASIVTGETPHEERQRLYGALAKKEINCLCSAGVLNVGLDIPEATVALMARPMLSPLMYRQSVGRVFRPYPSPEEVMAGVEHDWVKKYSIILDFVDVTSKHRLVTTPTLYGLRADFNLKGKKLVQELDKIEEIKTKHSFEDMGEFKDLDAIQSFAQKVDLLQAPRIPAEIKRLTNIVWHKEGQGYAVNTKCGKHIEIKKNQLGQWDVYISDRGVRKFAGSAKELKDGINLGESQIPIESKPLLDGLSGWRNNPPTPKQIATIKRFLPSNLKSAYNEIELENFILDKFPTSGDASNFIAKKFDRFTGKKAWVAK
jgi:superfamily II DNA or RNA helicase